MLAGLTVSGFMVEYMVRRQSQCQADEAAPIVMGLITRVARDNAAASPDELRRLLNNLTRVPEVQFCRLELLGAEGVAARTIEAHAAQGPSMAQRSLRADIPGPDGAVVGTLEVGYGAAPSPAATGMLWTATGLVAAACLAVFGVIYRRMRRSFRPIGFVRDNLLALHRGSEHAAELLMVRDAVGCEAEAWNALMKSIQDMQQELDLHRCRQTVTESLQGLQSQASQGILDALPIGVLRLDSEQRVAYANYSATRLLQFREEPEQEAALAERLPHPAVVETILDLRQHIGGTGIDCRLDHGGGHTLLRLTPISLGPERDDLVVTVQDITQLKEAERLRDEFLAHITHELRTPLTNIRAYAETLNDDFFDDEQTRRECYNVIMTETRRLTRLIENVLSVSQIEAGAARLTRVSLRVDESLRQAVQDVQAAADAKSIELTLRIPSKVPAVLGDRHRLHQVWTNLIGNAIKYTPDGGSVGVLVESHERMLCVRVTDTGIGVASDYQEKIFEKFVRVQNTAVEAEEGTGLGLPIAREIVRLHGGSLTMESEPGAGSTFTVELPIASSSEAVEPAQRELRPPEAVEPAQRELRPPEAAKPVGTTDGAISDS